MANSATFYDNVLRLAGLHGIRTHEHLARLLGVTAQTLTLWKNRRRQPGTDVMVRLRDTFEVDGVDLLDKPIDHPDVWPVVTDRERFARVESRIRRGGLQAI